MDKDHRLDAPNNESLSDIEQLNDRSELTTIYPHAHEEWEGTDLMSHDDREEKRDKEQVSINRSIRKWFVVLGLLAVTPFVLLAIMLAAGTIILPAIRAMNPALVIIPASLGALIWIIVSYKAIRGFYTIFYNHAIKATPFLFVLLVFLTLTAYPLFELTRPYHTELLLLNAIILGVAISAISIMYSGILTLIWTTSRMRSSRKVLLLDIIGVVLLAGGVFLYLF